MKRPRLFSLIADFLAVLALFYAFIVGPAMGILILATYLLFIAVAWLSGARIVPRDGGAADRPSFAKLATERLVVAELVGGPADGSRLIERWPPPQELSVPVLYGGGRDAHARYRLAAKPGEYDVIGPGGAEPESPETCRAAYYVHEEAS
jgi:hypothetical protein